MQTFVVDSAYVIFGDPEHDLLTINNDTGVVSFDRADFNYLAAGELAEYWVAFTVQSGEDVSDELQIKITITGENDLPTVTVSDPEPYAEADEFSVYTIETIDLFGLATIEDADTADMQSFVFDSAYVIFGDPSMIFSLSITIRVLSVSIALTSTIWPRASRPSILGCLSVQSGEDVSRRIPDQDHDHG